MDLRDDPVLTPVLPPLESDAWRIRPGCADANVLVVVDHASARLPDGVDLGVSADAMASHIALDIGTNDVADLLPYQVFAARYSRLYCDCNRAASDPSMMAPISDGIVIPGNQALNPAERQARMATCWRPYHQALARLIERMQPRLILSLHSFTPVLASRPQETRPWPVGVLYNQDDRAARLALDWFRALGVNVGDQRPYSGVELNYTMDRHAEANGLPYVGIELRQDEISDVRGQTLWARRLQAMVEAIVHALG